MGSAVAEIEFGGIGFCDEFMQVDENICAKHSGHFSTIFVSSVSKKINKNILMDKRAK
jgi:hypothetical protein